VYLLLNCLVVYNSEMWNHARADDVGVVVGDDVTAAGALTRSYALTWCMPNNDDDDDIIVVYYMINAQLLICQHATVVLRFSDHRPWHKKVKETSKMHNDMSNIAIF